MKTLILTAALALAAWCGDVLFNEGRLGQKTWQNAQDAGWALRARIAHYTGPRRGF